MRDHSEGPTLQRSPSTFAINCSTDERREPSAHPPLDHQLPLRWRSGRVQGARLRSDHRVRCRSDCSRPKTLVRNRSQGMRATRGWHSMRSDPCQHALDPEARVVTPCPPNQFRCPSHDVKQCFPDVHSRLTPRDASLAVEGALNATRARRLRRSITNYRPTYRDRLDRM